MRIILTTLASALTIGLVTASGASAAADVEGVWSYDGKVAVQPAGDGTFKGTVLTATSFAECPHPPGQVMWQAMTLQGDGQYWGTHQWYHPGCALAGQGRTAWRVLAKPDATKFLRWCSAPPETPEVQPSIAPDGTTTNAPRRCHDSDLLAPADTKPPTFKSTVVLPPPGAKKCRSRRAFRLRLKEPTADALASAVIYLNGKRVKTLKGKRITATVDLRGLPKGRYVVKVVATTVLGRTISGSRKYRTCAQKKRIGRKFKI